VTLLASGRLMYTGPTDGLTRWFTSIGYHYDPAEHGMASDWALDLVSLGFTKPQQGTRGQQDDNGAHPEQQQQRHSSSSQQQRGEPESDDSLDDNCSIQPVAILPNRASSSRYRGLASIGSGSIALHGVASSRYQRQASAAQQQQAGVSASKCSMMSSKQELNEAAASFLQHLRALHPAWFVASSEAAAAWKKTNNTTTGGSSSLDLSPSSSPGSALSPIKVHRGAAAAAPAGNADFRPGPTAAGGADVDESPFMQQQDALDLGQDPLQQQPGDRGLYLTPTALLEQGQERDQGVWNTLYGGWRKFCALLWREALITTRWGASQQEGRNLGSSVAHGFSCVLCRCA
jgi:hypothetical protein